MRIYIDQSGKVEDTSKPTIIAYTNGTSKSIYISKKDKRKLKNVFRLADKPHVYTFRTFANLIYLLIEKDLDKIQEIMIDIEYEGREDLIIDTLLQNIRNSGRSFAPKRIHFILVGKSHPCHSLAISVYRKKSKPSLVVGYKEVLDLVI